MSPSLSRTLFPTLSRARPQRLRRAAAAALATALALSAAPLPAQESEPSLTQIVEAWLGAPHGDRTAPSFTYWNEAGEVPPACAACHSEPGFIDFLGADGSTPGVVDHAAAINSPIGCAACHTGAAHALDAVSFPSGVEVAGLGANATCMVCHQGRQSGDTVAAAVTGLDPDAVSSDLEFLNIHYRASAATLLGGTVRGGYEYPGRSYAGRFVHVPSANSCVTCHDPHTTQVDPQGCLTCHQGAETPRDIRTRHDDFDGDGDIAEGVHGEVMTLHARLAAEIRAYAKDHGGAVGYHAARYPYFFADTDGDGEIAEAEAVYANAYAGWTPRLLQAAYNYQVVAKDPGGYTHNPTYFLQLLHDSIADLSPLTGSDISGLSRP